MLILVVWQPDLLSLEMPEKLPAVRGHLEDLASQLGLLMDQVVVWVPPAAFGGKIKPPSRWVREKMCGG